MKNIEDRITEIERRLTRLEVRENIESSLGLELPQASSAQTEALIQITISNKRYDPSNPSAGTFEDHIWFDCIYVLASDAKATRAIKGVIEFADLFGDVKFRLNTTLNEPLTPGQSLPQPGVGFTYNQFMAEHQWMLATTLKDMKSSFKALNILYADGASESFV